MVAGPAHFSALPCRIQGETFAQAVVFPRKKAPQHSGQFYPGYGVPAQESEFLRLRDCSLRVPNSSSPTELDSAASQQRLGPPKEEFADARPNNRTTGRPIPVQIVTYFDLKAWGKKTLSEMRGLAPPNLSASPSWPSNITVQLRTAPDRSRCYGWFSLRMPGDTKTISLTRRACLPT